MMQALAQQWIREGKREGKRETEKKWKEEKREMATRMLLDNCSIEKVIKYTGMTEEEIQSLMN